MKLCRKGLKPEYSVFHLGLSATLAQSYELWSWDHKRLAPCLEKDFLQSCSSVKMLEN